MSYSQNNEQHYITEFFKDNKDGRFIDIGAYDFRTFSNTLALIEKGWSGVGIEPSPFAFIAAMKTCEQYPQIKLVNAAISTTPGLVEFAESKGDAIGTTSKSHESVWATQVKYQHIYVNTITIREILRVFGEQFDFISLDVEGTNLEILKTLPLQIMNPSLICIEHEGKIDEIKNYCQGYEELHRNGENIILKKA